MIRVLLQIARLPWRAGEELLWRNDERRAAGRIAPPSAPPPEPREPLLGDCTEAEQDILANAHQDDAAGFFHTLWDIELLSTTLRHRVLFGGHGVAEFDNVDEAWEFALSCDPGLHPSPPYPVPSGVRA